MLVPFVTIGIIALNIAAWIFLQGLGSPAAVARSVCELGLIPGQVLGTLPAGTAVELGPGMVCRIGGSLGGLTLFTSMFLHGGWLHLIGNMWFLWIFGNNVEDAMGHLRFFFFYLICGLVAAGLQMAFTTDPSIPMVGASGAIGGVMGAYVLLYPRVQVHMLIVLGFFITVVAVPAVLMLGYWFLLQLAGGLYGPGGGGVAFWAHVGGFVAGAVLVFVFRNPALLRRHPYYGWKRRSPYRNWQRVRRRRF